MSARFESARVSKNAFKHSYTVECTLSFHSLLFLFYQGKTSNLPRIFSHCRTHRILGKDRENTKITKEIPCLKLTKEILKTKEWKDRAGTACVSECVLKTLACRGLRVSALLRSKMAFFLQTLKCTFGLAWFRGCPSCLESLDGGLANGGLRYLSTIVHDCLQLSPFCDESSP